MQVGAKHWGMVSTDSGGVPHGGRFGNVRWFERAAQRRGLYLGWSKLWECFGIFTRPHPHRYVAQMLCRHQDTGEPIPLTRELLGVLVCLWEDMAHHTGESLIDAMRKLNAEQKYKETVEQQKLDKDMEADVIRATELRRGYRTPNLMFLPRNVRTRHGRRL